MAGFFLAPFINNQQVDANGAPLSGGTITIYYAGTSTPAGSWSDGDGLIANLLPITLNTLGVSEQGEIWVGGGFAYKFVIKNAAGIVQRTLDYVSGINDTTITANQWVVFQGTPTFVSANSFTVPGDQTQIFVFGTRVMTTNTGGIVYGTVVRSVFSSATTVTIIPDSGTLDSGLSVVSTALLTPTNPAVPTTLVLESFRNRILNGSLRNDQRNNGVSQAITAGAATYTTDRFYVSCTGANIASIRGAGTGYTFSQTLTGAASVTATLFGQRIEALNCSDWVNKLICVQVPISAVGITTATWNAYTADVFDTWGAKTLIATGTIPLSGTVETKFFSFNAPSGASRGVAIEITTGALVAGQSITFQGAYQAEADRPTPYELIDVGEDLRRCQRYYETGLGVLDGYQLAANAVAVRIAFKVTKRVTPTLGYSGSSIVNLTTADARNPAIGSLTWFGVATASGAFVWEGSWTAAAEL